MKCDQLVGYPGIHECIRDDGTSRETSGGGSGLKKQPGKNNREVKRADKTKSYEMRVEVGVKESSKKKLMMSI